jgi:SAM-dependent methyltransferase
MPPDIPANDSLPSPELLAQQSDWLAPARSRLFRRVQIAHRRRVLDLGCGWQTVTTELARRSGGTVIAADSAPQVFATPPEDGPTIQRVRCDAASLPFRSGSFDLVFCQFALLWFGSTTSVSEIRRVLGPGGVVVAIEPDYGGLIEFPDEIATADLWQAALRRAGAEPQIGRHLPGMLSDVGFDVRVDLLDRLTPPSPLRFDLLRELPLTDEETTQLDGIIAADSKCHDAKRVAHLPVFLVSASVA